MPPISRQKKKSSFSSNVCNNKNNFLNQSFFNMFIKDLIKGKKKIDSGKKFLNNLNTWTLYGEDDLVGFISGVKSVPLYCISLNLALSFFNLWRYKTRFIVVWNQDSYSDLKRQKLNVFAGIKRDRFLKWDRILIRVLPSVTNCNHISLGLLIEILWEICD